MSDGHDPRVDKAGRLKLSRRRPKEQLPQMKRYITETGTVLWEWNSLHAGIFVLFHAFLRGTDPRLTQAIWLALPSDSAQRQMVLAMAEVVLEQQPQHLARVRWIIKTTDKLAEYRNIAAHVAMVLGTGEDVGAPLPDRFTTKLTKALRSILIFFKRRHFWDVLANDLFILGSYTGVLAAHLLNPDETLPLPRRPKLQSLPTIAEIDAEIGHLKPTPARKPRRRASRRKSAP